MKKISVLISIGFLIVMRIEAQSYSYSNVYTKNNTSVEVKILTSGDYSTATKLSINSAVALDHPSATILSSATYSYNCHSFAWHLSEGHSDSVWMNPYELSSNPNLAKYWSDGSFIEVCNESDADKVHYYNGDHSAMISSVSGKYESKWGDGPRVRHDPTDVPAIYNSSYRNYYASTRIMGSLEPLCSGTRTFNVKSISGATYTWTRSANLSFVGDSTLSSVTVQRNDTLNAIAGVSVVITSPCHTGSVTSTVYFAAGKPSLQMMTPTIMYYFAPGDENEVCIEAENYYDFIPSPYTTSITWSQTYASPAGLSWTDYNDGKGLYLYMWKNNQKVILRMTATNTCGTANYDFSFKAVDCSGFRMMMYPNPTSSELTIQAEGEDILKEIRITDKAGSLKKKIVFADKKTRVSKLNISSLRPDTYIVHVFNGKNWVSRQLIKK